MSRVMIDLSKPELEVLTKVLNESGPVIYASDGWTYLLNPDDREQLLALRHLVSVGVNVLMLDEDQATLLRALLVKFDPIRHSSVFRADFLDVVSDLIERLDAEGVSHRVVYTRKSP